MEKEKQNTSTSIELSELQFSEIMELMRGSSDSDPASSIEKENRDMALEELKILQSIIDRQDRLKALVKRFALTLFMAISAAFVLTDIQREISSELYLVFIGLSLIAVYVTEAFYGVTEIHAEERVQKIEKFLRRTEEAKYDGPRISESLLRPSRTTIKEALGRPRTKMFYILLFLLAIVMSVSSDIFKKSIGFQQSTTEATEIEKTAPIGTNITNTARGISQ